jgi:flavin reductase (DIM6/NTAB) family NADH-FMN oxidoreductase RutF
MSESDDLAGALGRVVSGLFIVTARHGADETGMLVSWVQQCSFDPPQIVVAMNRQRAVLEWLKVGARFTVNIIGEHQRSFVSHFGKGFALGEPAFAGLNVIRDGKRAPVLADALASLDCEVVAHVSSGGDHELLIGRVHAGRVQGEGRPTTHVRKNGLSY